MGGENRAVQGRILGDFGGRGPPGSLKGRQNIIKRKEKEERERENSKKEKRVKERRGQKGEK